MIKKTVIINRAVPGSGKTSITNFIVSEARKNNISISINSTDEYFMVGNKYMFEIDKLGKYHEKNLQEFEKSLENNVDIVICDNTNIAPWQTEAYTNIARANKYQIIFVTLDPRELIKHIESQKVTPEKLDAHGVSQNILKTMIKEYYIYDDLLNPRILIDRDKHVRYRWINKTNTKIITGIAQHFDSDFVIRILPTEYYNIKQNIGHKILELIKVSK